MYSPLRSSTSFTDSRLRSLIRSQDKDVAQLPDSFLAAESAKVGQMTEAFSKSLRTKIRQEVMKSPGRKCVKFEEDPQESEKQLLKRGEDFAKHILGQINRSEEDKKSETSKVQLSVNRALTELDSIKTSESERLQSRVNELKKNYQANVTRLERTVLKQIEQMKTEFLDDIRNEEVESYRRIKQATEKLATSIAPETKKSVMEKVFGGPVEPVRPVAKNRSLSSKRTKFTDYNTPEKKKLSREAMQRLSESRKRVMQLTSVSGQNTESEFITPKRTPKTTTDESDLRMEDFSDYAQSASTRHLRYEDDLTV